MTSFRRCVSKSFARYPIGCMIKCFEYSKYEYKELNLSVFAIEKSDLHARKRMSREKKVTD